MLVSINFKPHEVDAFELDHVIAYKQSLKFNLRNVLMEVNLENFLPHKLPAIRYMNLYTFQWPLKLHAFTYMVITYAYFMKLRQRPLSSG